VPGLQVGKIKQKTFYDDSVGAIEPMVAAFRGTGGAVATFYPGGDAAVGAVGYGSAVAEMLDTANIQSPIAGACILDADWVVSGGFEDVVAAYLETPTAGGGSPTYGAGVDNLAGTTKGASGYFHITAIDAAATVSAYKFQHSTDNATWVDLLTSGLAGTAIGADRQATAAGATINRYTRVSVTITNAKNATLAMAFSRH